MIFMADLPASELEQLGTVFLDKKMAARIERLSLENGGFVAEGDELALRAEREEQKRIMMCAVHMYWHSVQVASRSTDERGQRLYLTPAHFLRMFHYHERLLREKKNDMDGQIEKYNSGLQRLRDTQNLIHEYHMTLSEKEPELIARLDHIQRVVSEIEEEFERIKKKREDLKQTAHTVEGKANTAKEIKTKCETTVNKIVPSLNQAINSIDQIDKQDLA